MGYLGDLKTKASQRVMPLHKDLAGLLEQLRVVSPHNKPTDWVFASTIKNGTVPIWPTSLMVDHIQPTALRAGVKTHVTWKMFRTSIATHMNANGENIKTSQHTLGHANSQITANVYTQAVPSAVRSAHDRIGDMVIAGRAPAKVALLLSGPKWPQIPEGDAVSC